MNLSLRRGRPAKNPARHTPAGVRAATSAAELAEPAGRHAAAAPGTAPSAPLSAADAAAVLAPGARPSTGLPFEGASETGLRPASHAPSGDDTIVFRAPDQSGVPGYAIPPGTPWMTHPDGALPHRTPGAVVPPGSVPALRTEPADPGLLRDLRDALLALPAGPDRKPPVPPRPVAWLRAVQPEGFPHLDAALAGRPRFVRAVSSQRGQLAEVHLGETDDGPYRIAADAEWLKATAMVMLQAADAMPSSDITRTDIPAVPAAGGVL